MSILPEFRKMRDEEIERKEKLLAESKFVGLTAIEVTHNRNTTTVNIKSALKRYDHKAYGHIVDCEDHSDLMEFKQDIIDYAIEKLYGSGAWSRRNRTIDDGYLNIYTKDGGLICSGHLETNYPY